MAGRNFIVYCRYKKKLGFLNFFLLIFFSLINDIPFPFSLGNECEQQYAAIFDIL